jgi:hypothetical protein
MARKELDWSGATGRDAGKKFHITEMSARAGHDWATRALLALANSGADVGEDIMSRGLAGIASLALNLLGRIPADRATPLLNELLGCVTIDHGKGSRKLIDDDFEEIATIFQLQKEVFMLHIEPFTQGGLLTSESSPTAP